MVWEGRSREAPPYPGFRAAPSSPERERLLCVSQGGQLLEYPFEISDCLGMGGLLRRQAACPPKVFDRFA